ncbi:SPOR domain-containing protein [bacterium]|nr:SPOR domain-containing protein [bacterium]
MELKSSSGAHRKELERLCEYGVLVGFVTLERLGEPRERVLVRPVIGDGLAGWMPDLESSLDVVKGVVGISGTDMAEAAGLAADAAAWLGDRGRAVVLVDAAVEHPVLGKALYEDRDEGLVDAVVFGVSRAAVVRRTLAPGVSVVTAGSHPLSVDSVFETVEFARTLRGLADDALVLVIVPPSHVSQTLSVLDAAVCVAGSSAELESLASLTGDVRTIGVLVSEGRELDVDAGDSVDAGESVGLEGPGERVEDPALVPSTGAEPGIREKTEARQGEPTPEGCELAEDGGEARPEGTESAEGSSTLIGSPSRRSRGKPHHVAITVAVLVIVGIATILWWFVDGERRFASRLDGPARTAQERVLLDQGTEISEDRAVPPGEPSGDVPADEGAAGADEGAAGADRGAGGAGEDVVSPDDDAVRAAPEPLDGDALIRGPGGRYHIMISSHRHEGAAVFEAGQLVEQGVAAEVAGAEVEDRGTWFRVVVSGGYPTVTSAREVLDTIKFLGYEGAWIERVADNK